ncbi:hypothetical protein VTN96DRAFT_7746 [Rasamsonia emersonii]
MDRTLAFWGYDSRLQMQPGDQRVSQPCAQPAFFTSKGKIVADRCHLARPMSLFEPSDLLVSALAQQSGSLACMGPNLV